GRAIVDEAQSRPRFVGQVDVLRHAERGHHRNPPGAESRSFRPPMIGCVSPFWSITLRLFYWVISRLQPLVRLWVEGVGFGNVVELIVVGRRTGRRRVVLLGLLRVDARWYLGHPNGPANWTQNLDFAGTATLVLPHLAPIEIRPELLPDSEERRRVI